MAPRANWKGFLRLSLVTCPVALYPATSESEKVSFNQLNRKTGHRIKYAKDSPNRPRLCDATVRHRRSHSGSGRS
jgi:DNA end-binding protein Ku